MAAIGKEPTTLVSACKIFIPLGISKKVSNIARKQQHQVPLFLIYSRNFVTKKNIVMREGYVGKKIIISVIIKLYAFKAQEKVYMSVIIR